MGIEIERKFLARMPDQDELTATGSSSGGVASAGNILPVCLHGDSIRQGYICSGTTAVTRVRVRNTRGFITLKGPVAADGMSRLEFEYEIPFEDANQMLGSLCSGSIIEKTRYEIPFGGILWELDVFFGDNKGLIIAEVELVDPFQTVTLPDWVLEEVSGNLRYSNSSLARSPYSSW